MKTVFLIWMALVLNAVAGNLVGKNIINTGTIFPNAQKHSFPWVNPTNQTIYIHSVELDMFMPPGDPTLASGAELFRQSDGTWLMSGAAYYASVDPIVLTKDFGADYIEIGPNDGVELIAYAYYSNPQDNPKIFDAVFVWYTVGSP